MAVAKDYIGKAPIGGTMSSGLQFVVFDIDDETAITAFYCGENTYEDFAEVEIKREGERLFFERYGVKYYLDEIVRAGTFWLESLPTCENIR